MQDRYVGDIGDYFKLAILRALRGNHRLGVLWWRYPDEAHNSDGRHIAYLSQAERWRACDAKLFDALAVIVARGDRRIEALQECGIIPGTTYVDSHVPTVGPAPRRREDRQKRFAAAATKIQDCDLLFLDPDNGLETSTYDAGSVKAGKSVSVAELIGLRREGRSIIVYHHQTRRAGGHLKEIEYWQERLADAGFSTVDVLRASSFSSRAFFFSMRPHRCASQRKR